MEITKQFCEEIMDGCKKEQESLRVKIVRQDGAIAILEMIVKKLEEEKS